MSEIDRRWIVANLIVLAVFGASAFLDFALGMWLGASNAEATIASQTTYVAMSTLLTVAGYAFSAWLIGRVLQRILPALPWRPWIMLHVVIGLVLGVGFGMLSLSESEPADRSELELFVILVGLVVAAVLGALLGAVSGSLQALVLRRAADGLRRWIAFSSLSVALVFVAIGGVALALPLDGIISPETAIRVAVIIAGIASTFVMLPAVRRLRPRAA